jgi:AraC-like DNA-binding protein
LLYQKIFSDDTPYYIGIGNLSKFPEHRHADFEFNYCVDGEFDIIIEKKKYHVGKGCMSFIPPMCSHEVPEQDDERQVMTLIVGVSLLKKHFSEFSKLAAKPCVYDFNKEENTRIKELFCESVNIKRADSKSRGAELLITGNIYKILAYIFELLSYNENSEPAENDLRRVENVEKAIELIHSNYKEQLTLEYVSELTGYSKSNFCKIFKKVVGEGFHQSLNRHRAECAAGLLTVSNMSVADISEEVGFSEPKAFCRVFKAIYGITPGQYRKDKKQ